MNVGIHVLNWIPPPLLRRWAVLELSRVVARASGESPPSFSAPDGPCAQFALFSRDLAARAIASGATHDFASCLRQGARDLGMRWRGRLNIHDVSDGMAAAQALYRLIGIDFRADSQGRIEIVRCALSAVYSPEICAVMSAMDEGILAGLAGEGSLSFACRITEGHPACMARFVRRTA
ncbi:hypothetical protein JXA88_14415 [Candidatus Fermentibacteria bacterium]|nr:hypothetical protein [Candidatus Fermentibacteria bacterium]